MKTFSLRPLPRHLTIAVGLLACLSAPELGAKDEPKASVELSETAQAATLSNGAVKLVFNKSKGTLDSLSRDGRELLSSGGGYVQIAFTSRRDNPRITWNFRVLQKTPELIEVAFVNTSLECPFDFETHYILRAGDSGFYNYLVWGHDVKRSPAVLKLAQYNFALRVDSSLFTTAAVDDQRIARFPKGDLLTEERLVMDSTYQLPEGGYYSKYFFSAERDEKHRIYGAMTDAGLGIWLIMPSYEYLNGGPEHQELTVHQAGGSQVLLAHAQGAHYGAGILTSDPKNGSWRKVSAPWFVYVNSAASQAAAWEDANRRAVQEVAAWPYRWLDDASFQLDRGSVKGRLVLADHVPVGGARVILADHEDKPTALGWQQQWRGYRFYGWADKEGRFNLGKVRPGNYDLYAWQPGSFGQFLQSGVQVGPKGEVNLGELVWKLPPGRKTLWQIGTPDHSAEEFGFAENFRQWGLWQKIADATPNGVTFVAGKSPAREWPFQMATTQNADMTWKTPLWRVEFENNTPRVGQAVLTLGIAGYEGRKKPQLSITLNGQPVGTVADLEISGASHRSGIHAGYQERSIFFDASLLKPGKNELVLEMPSPGKASATRENLPSTSLLWDSLRLEAPEPAGAR